MLHLTTDMGLLPRRRARLSEFRFHLTADLSFLSIIELLDDEPHDTHHDDRHHRHEVRLWMIPGTQRDASS